MAIDVQYRTALVRSSRPDCPTLNWRSTTLNRFLSHCCLIPMLLVAGAADVHAQNVQADKTSLSFSALLNGSPVTQSLTITSTTSQQIPFFVFPNAGYIKVNGQTSFNGTTPATVTISVDPTGLSAGQQPATSITIGGGSQILNVPVNVTVSTIGANPSSVSFTGYTAGSATIPVPQSITLSGPS